jgi:hypothetical protein
MARGWESKSVEEQQSERGQPGSHGPRLNPEQAAHHRQLGALLLSRKQVEHDLESTTNLARREMLQRALSDLDAKVASLQPEPKTESKS